MKKLLLIMFITLNLFATSDLSMSYDPNVKNIDIFPQDANAINENDEDWVGIYYKDDSNDWENMQRWEWVKDLGEWDSNGKAVKAFDFDELPAGNYEVRYFLNNSFNTYRSQAFTVGDDGNNPIVSIENQSDITLTLNSSRNSDNEGDTWVGIYYKSDNNDWDNVQAWSWVTEDETMLNISELEEGEYEARLFYNNSYTVESKIGFSVSKDIDDDIFTEKQLFISEQIISIFENSTVDFKYDYAEHLDDLHGITAGRAGFTSATGDMWEVIEAYSNIKDNNRLIKYINELKRLNSIYANNDWELSEDGAYVGGLTGLIEDWKKEAEDNKFKRIQDDYVKEHYFAPALDLTHEIGATLPITLLNIYDASIQHGVDGARDIINEVNVDQPKNGGDEIAWLKAFNAKREYVMNHTKIDGEYIWRDTVYRVHALNDLIEAGKYNLNLEIFIVGDWGDQEFTLKQSKN